MFGKLLSTKLLLILGLIIALIHAVLFAITIVIHVVLLAPRLKKVMMKCCPFCRSTWIQREQPIECWQNQSCRTVPFW